VFYFNIVRANVGFQVRAPPLWRTLTAPERKMLRRQWSRG